MKKTLVTLLFFAFLLPPGLVLAEDTGRAVTDPGRSVTDPGRSVTDPGFSAADGSSNSVGLQNPLRSGGSIPELFQVLLDIVMVFAVPLIVFFIIYAGFMYVTARGNMETVQKAHRALLYALIGAIIIIGANVLVKIISGTVHSILK